MPEMDPPATKSLTKMSTANRGCLCWLAQLLVWFMMCMHNTARTNMARTAVVPFAKTANGVVTDAAHATQPKSEIPHIIG